MPVALGSAAARTTPKNAEAAAAPEPWAWAAAQKKATSERKEKSA